MRQTTGNIEKSLSTLTVEPTEQIHLFSKKFEQQGLKTFDAIHVACAVIASTDYFISTDKRLINKPIREIRTINPIDFVRLIRRETK